METGKSESKYERLRKIGVGSYGVVFKCVNRQSGGIVAIKRYNENDSDPVIRKIAVREVRMLRQLKHSNLINLIEVFRRKRRLHLVFDYCELTVLDVIEKYGNGCPINLIKKIVWQIVNGISYCHAQKCIHRDIKPENILINRAGVVKLCDFGFARSLNAAGLLQNNSSGQQQSLTPKSVMFGEKENLDRQALTEYVATRWYRAPELLIGEIYYDGKIDIWAIGCVTAELIRGEPIWPGQTDLDQLFKIKSSLGPLTSSQVHTLLAQSLYEPENMEKLMIQTRDPAEALDKKLPARAGHWGLDFIKACLQMDPEQRPTSDQLLQHGYIQSARMFQFVKEADSGMVDGAHLSASGGSSDHHHHNHRPAPARHLNLTSDHAARLTNSQALLLATSGSGQLVAASVGGANDKEKEEKESASKRQQAGGESAPRSGLPVVKRFIGDKRAEQQATKSQRHGKTDSEKRQQQPAGLATIHQAQQQATTHNNRRQQPASRPKRATNVGQQQQSMTSHQESATGSQASTLSGQTSDQDKLMDSGDSRRIIAAKPTNPSFLPSLVVVAQSNHHNNLKTGQACNKQPNARRSHVGGPTKATDKS